MLRWKRRSSASWVSPSRRDTNIGFSPPLLMKLGQVYRRKRKAGSVVTDPAFLLVAPASPAATTGGTAAGGALLTEAVAAVHRPISTRNKRYFGFIAAVAARD